MTIMSQIRDQWLSILVLSNYWMRKHGFAPDEWYWADRELMDRGRTWMPCYWSMLRFRGLLYTWIMPVRIWWIGIKIKWLKIY